MPRPRSRTIFAAGIAFLCACAPLAAAERDTADTISLDPDAPNSYRAFAPELPETVARFPRIDPDLGLHLREVKPGIFFVTDGVYQSAFVRTGDGVIVIDAPPSFAEKLPGLITAHAPKEPVRYLLYSHSHADHIGGARVFSGVSGLRILAAAGAAAAIEHEKHPGILPPNTTFETAFLFSLGARACASPPRTFTRRMWMRSSTYPAGTSS